MPCSIGSTIRLLRAVSLNSTAALSTLRLAIGVPAPEPKPNVVPEVQVARIQPVGRAVLDPDATIGKIGEDRVVVFGRRVFLGVNGMVGHPGHVGHPAPI